jgi:hypothetical protein
MVWHDSPGTIPDGAHTGQEGRLTLHETISADRGNLLPMETRLPTPRQIIDNEHLRLLSIFYYVKGGITALFACIPIIHAVLGLVFIFAPQAFGHGNDQPPAFLGWLFLILGGFLILVGWTFAILAVITGRCVGRRKHYTFCLMVACIECVSVPFGTVLGIFTIVVLNRPSVKELFKPRPVG